MRKTTVRLAAAQKTWAGPAPEGNPFSDVFSMDAARAFSRGFTDGHGALVAQAGEQGADIVVTGEAICGLGLTATYLDDRSVFGTLVQETAAYCREVLSGLAKRYGMHVVGCFYEPEGDVVYNSAVLFGRDGAILGRYHKVNLPALETWLLTAGDSFPAFDTDLGPVGMLICYDGMWSEPAAAVAMSGAKIICHPSAAPMDEFRALTRSLDHQVFYVSSTPQDSIITTPDKKVLAKAGKEPETVIIGEAETERVTLAPENCYEYLYSGVRDHHERHVKLRQAGAYKILSDPNPPAAHAYTGGWANTLEKVWAAYEVHREECRKGLRGERGEWAWPYWEGE